MSARYGSRTRTGEAVSGLGRRGDAGGGSLVMYAETFTAPGTWTWPGKVSYVEVFAVGGGGGGGLEPLTPVPGETSSYQGGGGGGRVIAWQPTPVSAPMPVTIGAGGTGMKTPGGPGSIQATVGGTTAFGPLGPGPIPAIPAPTVAAGGGGAGVNYYSPQPIKHAPEIGGGGGGASSLTPPYYGRGGGGGTGRFGGFGFFGTRFPGEPGYTSSHSAGGGGGADTPGYYGAGGRGLYGFGGGGGSIPGVFSDTGSDGGGQRLSSSQPSAALIFSKIDGRANSGGGGAGNAQGGYSPAPLYQRGGDGGSGYLIVRWFE